MYKTFFAELNKKVDRANTRDRLRWSVSSFKVKIKQKCSETKSDNEFFQLMQHHSGSLLK